MTPLPPSAPEAEAGALGCLLLDPKLVIPRARQAFASPLVFFEERHQRLYETLLRMHEKDQVIDLITIAEALGGSMLSQIGGLAYISALQDQTPSSANFSYYAEIMLEKWRLRDVQQRATEILQLIDRGRPPEEIVGRWNESAVELTGAPSARTLKELSTEAYDDLMSASQRVADGQTIGLNIGIRTVDQRTKGLNPKELVVIAARPSMGKTSALLTIARNIAQTAGPVAYLSFESDVDELTKRLIGIEAMLDFQHPELWDENDHRRLVQATTAIGRLPVHLRCIPETPIDQVCALAIGLHNQFQLRALCLDSLGMIPGTRNHYQDKERVNEVIGYLYRLKKKLGIPLIVNHHLNRELEDGKRPQLKHLGQSGEVEKYADVVAFLHQPGTEDRRIHLPAVNASIIIAKRRSGATGDCEAEFLRYCGRWQDLPLGTAG